MTQAGADGITTVTVTPRAAADAYQRTDDSGAGAAGADSFGAALERVVGDAVAQGHAADLQATAAISGNGNITEVVTALARAELALQSATTIRDRVVSAYQEIMRMPI
jgi:flagellar hook-basal body complex protein FliE